MYGLCAVRQALALPVVADTMRRSLFRDERLQMDETLIPVRDLFNQWAREGRDLNLEKERTVAVREALREVGVPKGSNTMVLDVGCTNGFVVRALARRLPDATVMGVDISEAMIENARDLTPDDMYNAVFYHGTIFDTALDDERFDLIVASDSLYYFVPVAETLRRVAQLLKPGGQVVILAEYYQENESSHDWPRKSGVPMELLSASEYVRALTENGLEDVFQHYVRYPEGENWDAWRVEHGTLVTSAFKPHELSAEDILRDTQAATS